MEELRRILVVVNERTVLESIREVLSQDYQLIAARDALEAGDLLLDNQLDLLIISLDLPVLDGAELIRIIRTDPAFKDIPILALSSHTTRPSREVKLDVQGFVFTHSMGELTRRLKQIGSNTNAAASNRRRLELGRHMTEEDCFARLN
jgi:CheY-like chemotaxis protein